MSRSFGANVFEAVPAPNPGTKLTRTLTYVESFSDVSSPLVRLLIMFVFDVTS